MNKVNSCCKFATCSVSDKVYCIQKEWIWVKQFSWRIQEKKRDLYSYFLSLKDTASQLELFKLILDSIHNGSTITDPDGYILYFNKPLWRVP